MIKAANLTINVSDMDISIAFYKSIGFKEINRWGNHYAQLSATGMVIGLHPTAGKNLTGGSGNTSIGLTTENFEAAKAELQKMQIPFTERSEEGGHFLNFKDPDGTSLYFIQPKW